MITAVDTNILLDVFLKQPGFWEASWERLQRAISEGELIICDVVYAELVPCALSQAELDQKLQRVPVTLFPSNATVAYYAGLQWARYRHSGGPRSRLLPDFIIGAHALVNAQQLLTRDTGYFDTYFPELKRV